MTNSTLFWSRSISVGRFARQLKIDTTQVESPYAFLSWKKDVHSQEMCQRFDPVASSQINVWVFIWKFSLHFTSFKTNWMYHFFYYFIVSVCLKISYTDYFCIKFEKIRLWSKTNFFSMLTFDLSIRSFCFTCIYVKEYRFDLPILHFYRTWKVLMNLSFTFSNCVWKCLH